MSTNPKIFFSYTLRGNDLSYNALKEIKKRFIKINMYEVYIDRIDNEIPDTDNIVIGSIDMSDTNLYNNHQKKVIQNLLDSEIFCILESDEIENSEWVSYEKKLRSENVKTEPKTLTLKIKKKDWQDFIKLEKTESIMQSVLIKKIEFAKNHNKTI